MPQTCQRRALTVLQIEDNLGDVGLTSLALEECGFPASVFHVGTGWEALDFIKRQGRFENMTVVPDLVLLDLNLPGIHGQELLRFMRGHPIFLNLPVVVMSTSDCPSTMRECLKLANNYVVKHSEWDGFKKTFGEALRPYFEAG